MDYKEKLKAIINSNKTPFVDIDTFLKYFPELQESEDERIRKDLIAIITNFESLYLQENYSLSREKALAWLEKQGEQKPANKVEPKFKVGDIIRLKDGDGLEWTVEKVFNNGYYTIVCADRDDLLLLDDNWELVEQKPWSEEDENMINSIIRELIYQYNEEIPQGTEDKIKWLKNKLKFLRPQNWTKEDKERYISCLQKLSTGNPEQPETINSKWFKEHVYPKPQWKPSDKQIYSLDRVLSFYGKGTVTYDFVKELLEQLKKL